MLSLCIVFIIGMFNGCGVRYIVNSTEGAFKLKKEDAIEFKVEKTKVEAITDIEINTRIAKVELIESDEYYVEIDYDYWKEAPEYSIKDGTLYFDDEEAFPNSYSLNFDLKNVVRVYLPAAAALEKIELNNSSGDVITAGFVTEKLEANISYGNFSMKNAAAAQCDISLSSGNSTITDIRVGELNFSNSYGNATFKNINTVDQELPKEITTDSFDVFMSSGNLNINGLNCSTVSISNSYGEVTGETVTADTLDAALSSGDFNLIKADISEIDISNSYGDVNLSLAGAKEDYSMDLTTSYGGVKVDGKDYDENYSSNGGSRTLETALSSGDIKISFYK
jgi:DUF4097 and DUF4098 domain-containing protein YvlB